MVYVLYAEFPYYNKLLLSYYDAQNWLKIQFNDFPFARFLDIESILYSSEQSSDTSCLNIILWLAFGTHTCTPLTYFHDVFDSRNLAAELCCLLHLPHLEHY